MNIKQTLNKQYVINQMPCCSPIKYIQLDNGQEDDDLFIVLIFLSTTLIRDGEADGFLFSLGSHFGYHFSQNFFTKLELGELE